jgi:hypothetical protein
MNLLGDQGMGKVHAAGGTELRRFLGRRDLFTMRAFRGIARETAETLRTWLGRPGPPLISHFRRIRHANHGLSRGLKRATEED